MFLRLMFLSLRNIILLSHNGHFDFTVSRFTVRRLFDSLLVSVKCVPVSGFSSLSGSALQTEAGDIILMAPTLITASKQARLAGTTIFHKNP